MAEGTSRTSNKDFKRFLTIALGSCYEIETQLLITFDLSYTDKTNLDSLTNTLYQIIKMMSKFSSSLKIQ
ncbi:four helix bundle protein [uncultured Polaribacter sp.]|uniref:four helix bundle protein n=1 Tax=uncultured Polaribacter sp. TaxID=174711 RepID=UPI0026160774|nr:four helix bundle protein [uncultured Polaribacter sp.]